MFEISIYHKKNLKNFVNHSCLLLETHYFTHLHNYLLDLLNGNKKSLNYSRE